MPRLQSSRAQLLTGRTARVALVLRRERALELVRRYLDVMAHSDANGVAAALEPLFAETITLTDSGGVESRAQLLSSYTRVSQLFGAYIRQSYDHTGSAESMLVPALQSSLSDSALLAFELRPTDWVFTPPPVTRAGFPTGLPIGLPRELVVRLIDGEPRIVARSQPVARR